MTRSRIARLAVLCSLALGLAGQTTEAAQPESPSVVGAGAICRPTFGYVRIYFEPLGGVWAPTVCIASEPVEAGVETLLVQANASGGRALIRLAQVGCHWAQCGPKGRTAEITFDCVAFTTDLYGQRTMSASGPGPFGRWHVTARGGSGGYRQPEDGPGDGPCGADPPIHKFIGRFVFA